MGSPLNPKSGLIGSLSRSIPLERLPQFDFVAVGVVDPGEAAVAFVLGLGVDADTRFRQAIKRRVEIVDDVGALTLETCSCGRLSLAA